MDPPAGSRVSRAFFRSFLSIIRRRHATVTMQMATGSLNPRYAGRVRCERRGTLVGILHWFVNETAGWLEVRFSHPRFESALKALRLSFQLCTFLQWLHDCLEDTLNYCWLAQSSGSNSYLEHPPSISLKFE